MYLCGMKRKWFKIKRDFNKWFKTITTNQTNKHKRNVIKNHIRTFFEGYSYYFHDEADTIPPVVDIPIHRLGITNFKFKFKPNKILVIITLERPGLLIGKQGTTIDQLTKFLNYDKRTEVSIQIKESRVWCND